MKLAVNILQLMQECDAIALNVSTFNLVEVGIFGEYRRGVLIFESLDELESPKGIRRLKDWLAERRHLNPYMHCISVRRVDGLIVLRIMRRR